MIQVSSTNSVHEFPWLRQIQVRNSLGIPYVLFQDGFKIGLYKGNAIHPTSFSIVDNSHASTLTSISSCAIDSNDIIHILVANGHELEYITFNAMTDTYLSTETISFDPTIIPSHVSYNEYTLGAPYIAVDSNDVPHILFLGQENLWGGPAGAQFYYNNRIGGSWKSANILVSDTNFNNWTTTTFIVDGDDLPIIGTSIYIDGSSGSGYLYIGNANNATVFAQQSLGIVGRDGISIAVDKSGNHVIGLIDHATFKPGFRIHTRASAWDSWSAIITVPDILPYHTSTISIMVNGTDIYLAFYWNNYQSRMYSFEGGAWKTSHTIFGGMHDPFIQWSTWVDRNSSGQDCGLAGSGNRDCISVILRSNGSGYQYLWFDDSGLTPIPPIPLPGYRMILEQN